MRRALLVGLAALVVPAAALAQVPAPERTVIEVDNYNVLAQPATSYLNRAQCVDSAAPKVALEWNVPGANSGSYRLYATDLDPASRTGADQNFCLEADATNPDQFAGQIGGNVAVTAAVQKATVSGQEISDEASPSTTGATKVCDSDGKVIWVCAHWYNAQGARSGSAVGRFTVQLAEPARPSGVTVGNGPGSLTVSWDASTGGAIDADSYVAFARPVPDGSDVPAVGAPTFRSSSTNGTEATISGLENGQRYRVVVVAFSVGGNPSLESDPKFGTPSPVDGFWSIYESAGGREQGGCGSGGAGSLSLLAMAGLLAALRRRK